MGAVSHSRNQYSSGPKMQEAVICQSHVCARLFACRRPSPSHMMLYCAYMNVRSLLTSSCLGEALTKGLYVLNLNELGIVLSGDLDALLMETKAMLAEYFSL